MMLVKASETEFAFPVLAFVPGGESTGFPDRFWLRLFDRRLFAKNIYPGMELIDADGRRWITRRAYAVKGEYDRRWWQIEPFYTRTWTELELELEEIGAVTFSEIVERVASAQEAERQLIKPEKRTRDEYFAESQAELRDAKTVEEIYELFFDFEPGFWWGRK